MLGDHLGSTSVLVNQNGTLNATNYYYPYGDNRGGSQSTLTAKRFTGQYHEAGIGLYYYNARWYDSRLGRFTQADTIVPNPASSMSLNRYMYVAGNPLRYTDPSGHCIPEGPGDRGSCVPSPRPKPPKQKPWWENDPPPIHKIGPGGIYGDGTINWSGQEVSVYHPPLVQLYSDMRGYYPRYGDGYGGMVCPVTTCIGPYWEAWDYWYGEDYGNAETAPVERQNPIIQGSWEDVYSVGIMASLLNGRMSGRDIAAGQAYGRYLEDDSDAPKPGESLTFKGYADATADGLSIVAHGFAGMSYFAHKDLFYLQRNAAGSYRVIILFAYRGFPGQYYQTRQGIYPAQVPFTIDRMPINP